MAQVIMPLALLSACATTAPKKPVAGAKPPEVVTIPEAFHSTYKVWPGVPTLLKGATVWDGTGKKYDRADVLFADGKIVQVGANLAAPAGAVTLDGSGKWVTPGIIDIHSHLGNYPSPGVDANSDGNEVTGPVRSEVWSEHGIWPQDPGFSRALAGGITTLHILPGSANLFGGRGVTLKNVYGRTAQDMVMPGAPMSLKMACGENPKRVYGRQGRMPGSRMGNVALMRQTWMEAQAYKRRWDDYNARAKDGKAKPTDAPARNLQMETLQGVLEGKILVQNHCYRADEMANIIAMSKEVGYKVTTFHHAVESYKIADLLKKEGICSAMWADWYGFKMESYDGIRENLPFVHAAGACAVTHSDDADGIQRLNQETAKALSDGRRVGLKIADEEAIMWNTLNPAKGLGIDKLTGSLEAGKEADVVLWNGNPLSVYARPEKVWVDGALMYDALDPKKRPVSDFELGQPGKGDVK
nr:amidohydrolase [Sandaracinobacteroides saxicola]